MEATPSPELTDGYYYALLRWRGIEYAEWIERKGGEWQFDEGEELMRVIERMEYDNKKGERYETI